MEGMQGGPETLLDDLSSPIMAPAHGGKGGVSHKIQQLLNTLKRPKKNRRPIEDYYLDDENAGMCCLSVCLSVCPSTGYIRI